MKRTLLTLFAAALLCSPLPALAQIGQTAALTGTVTDATGAVLPGATVTVAGETLIGGSRTAVTDADGRYRFPALPPGKYTVTTELASFKKFEQDVVLELGQTITLDAKLEVGGLTDVISVRGESPQVDVRSSATQKNLTTEVMENIPFTNRFGPGAMLMAPGVHPTNYSAYGSGGSSSNSYMIDGVDVSDPEGGTIWLFANHNWIQEVQVIGLGASAEYGGFTGVASNSLFRSGGNMFNGLFETLYENDAMTGENVSDEVLELNEDLTPGKTHYVTDSTIQIGGPIKRDKAWFFTSFQYYRPKTAPAGYPPDPPHDYLGLAGAPLVGPEAREEKSPRFLFKPTLKLGDNDQITGFFETDSYTVDGRAIGSNVGREAGLHQDSPELAWNGNYTRVLSSTSVFDIKYSGFWGYYYLTPYNGMETPGWYDVDEDFYAVNSYYYYKADRTRNQANATLTKFASGFAGEHNFKFGAEFERSNVKSEYGYPGGMYVNASFGVPYYAYLYDGYLTDNRNGRISLFAQDSWTIGSRFTFNPGVRFDRNTGYNKALDRQVFKTNSIAPRIGFAWDVTGDSRTVVRGHYGWYFDGSKASYYNLLDPNQSPFYGAYIDEHLNVISDVYLITPGTNRIMDEDIKHPRMKQSILGLERDLGRSFSVGVTGIWRDNDQFIDDVLTTPLSEYSVVTLPDPGPDGVAGTGDETGTVLTLYDQQTDALENEFLITNPEGAYRRYRGVELSANKRMSNRWQMQASWVISKITGNYNNTGNAGNSTTEYNNPNTDPRFQPLREGRLTNDNTHIAKVIGSYRTPGDFLVSGAFFYTTGQAWARTIRTARFGQGRSDVFAEERGSQRFDDQPRFDFKVEKQFQVTSGGRLGLTFEGFNLFNNAAITGRTARSGSSYNTPTSLVQARRFRIGAVYRF